MAKGLNILVKMAQNIRTSQNDESFIRRGSLEEFNITNTDIAYLVFLDKQLPIDMENSNTRPD